MQLSLLPDCQPAIDPDFSRLKTQQLSGDSWIAHQSSWLRGDSEIFTVLRQHTRWRTEERVMYGRDVRVPRLVATLPEDGSGHPVLAAASQALSTRFGRPLPRISMNLYQTGQDCVAMHGDRVGDRLTDSVMAIVSVGAPRIFRLRPNTGGASLDFRLGWGDLMVLGGAIHANWTHGVPRSRQATGPRISVMFRETHHPA